MGSIKKAIKFGLFAALMTLLYVGCNNDYDYNIDDQHITIGNIEGDQDHFIVVTDEGDRLYPSENKVPGYPVNDGDRLWVNYTVLKNGEENSEIDYYVMINYFKDILTKDIFLLTPDNADSIGHNPIWVNDPENDIWIANNYLNIFFIYRGVPWLVHYINVVSDTNNPTTPEGIPVLELRHNKNNDPYNQQLLNGFISINIKSLQETGRESVKFFLRAIDENGEYGLNKEFVYKYTPDTTPRDRLPGISHYTQTGSKYGRKDKTTIYNLTSSVK